MASAKYVSTSFLTVGLSVLALSSSTSSFALTLDGSGHYSLSGATLTKPAFQTDRGEYQAINQKFELNLEARANDQLSMFLDLGIFTDPRRAYLGTESRPAGCARRTKTTEQVPNNDGTNSQRDIEVLDNQGSDSNCDNRHQSSADPRYKPYQPQITQAYVQYAFDFCLMTAGRRGRDWGIGALLDSGKGMYAQDASVFDGFTCDINVQKSQTLGISFGYDKLQESGPTIADDSHVGDADYVNGDTRQRDDLDQYFFTVMFDDRKANAGRPFTQQVGFYFANILGPGPLKTDVKIADLYTAFYLKDLTFKNEVIFRLGKSADPSWVRYGGIRSYEESPNSNNVSSIASAGNFEYTLHRTGSAVGPQEFNQGTLSAHKLFIDYAYAPGDADGYFPEYDPNQSQDKKIQRKNTASAFAFHRNFKPALILFNDAPASDDLRVDGAFDPGRVMNATVYGGGYRYESTRYGNFEFKLLTAFLNAKIPGEVKDDINAKQNAPTAGENYHRPVGYSGKNLGTEVDLKYDMNFNKDVVLGGAAALALPGVAWHINKDEKPKLNMLLESHVGFRF